MPTRGKPEKKNLTLGADDRRRLALALDAEVHRLISDQGFAASRDEREALRRLQVRLDPEGRWVDALDLDADVA